ncbi:hypothetical protein [Fluviicola sp.]|uniref:hypothetical protein n=1 Tax=Fluviicola sp. TaxID=1917219 RepID=UPI003D2CEBE1
MKAAFTICSLNYLSLAMTLKKSIRKTNPELPFFIFLADKLNGVVSDESIIEIETIQIPEAEFKTLTETYNIIEFNTALKPFIIEFLDREKGFTSLIYLDPDIVVYQHLDAVWNELADSEFILTPHMIEPIQTKELDYLTLGTINTGVFNLGFIGLQITESSRKFISWWKNHLLHYGHNNILNGEFYDQKVMNLLPVYSDKTVISRNFGLNVAEWNLHERKLSKVDGNFFVNEHHPLIFFHFSGVKMTTAAENSQKNSQFKRTQSDQLSELLSDYIASNIENGFEQLKNIPCHYKLRPNIHRASRWEIYKFKLNSWLKSK